MRWLVSLVVAGACGAPAEQDVMLRFTPDPGMPGGERYQCFGFDAAPLGDADLGAIRFDTVASPVLAHHLSLYAIASAFPDGPVDCVEMPDEATPMNTWVPGAGDVELAPDVSLVVPAGTTRLVVQVHALRTGDGEPVERTIELEPRSPAVHRAGWLPVRAPVPVIQPGERVEATTTCVLASALHVVSTWPHMHQIGAEFHGLVDVVPWVFDAQRTYPLDLALAAGDAIETHCVWENTTSAPVLPGPRITDEMCGQSLVAYPFEATRCQ